MIDSYGCSATISAQVSQPNSLNLNYTSTPIQSYGGTSFVHISANGGTAPYYGTGTYNLNAGSHTYIVTDSNGCMDSVTFVLIEPDSLNLIINSTPILCFNDSSNITVSAVGGVPPFSGTGVHTSIRWRNRRYYY